MRKLQLYVVHAEVCITQSGCGAFALLRMFAGLATGGRPTQDTPRSDAHGNATSGAAGYVGALQGPPTGRFVAVCLTGNSRGNTVIMAVVVSCCANARHVLLRPVLTLVVWCLQVLRRPASTSLLVPSALCQRCDCNSCRYPATKTCCAVSIAPMLGEVCQS